MIARHLAGVKIDLDTGKLRKVHYLDSGKFITLHLANIFKNKLSVKIDNVITQE